MERVGLSECIFALRGRKSCETRCKTLSGQILWIKPTTERLNSQTEITLPYPLCLIYKVVFHLDLSCRFMDTIEIPSQQFLFYICQGFVSCSSRRGGPAMSILHNTKQLQHSRGSCSSNRSIVFFLLLSPGAPPSHPGVGLTCLFVAAVTGIGSRW